MLNSSVIHPIRFSSNPLVSTADVRPSSPEMEVLCAFNPGATLFNGERLLLIRVAERPIQEEGYVSIAVVDAESGSTKVLRFRLDDPNLDYSDPRLIRYKGVGYITSLSHFRTATSTEGVSFQISDCPTYTGLGKYETFGVEDTRIIQLDGRYYLTYTGVSAYGVLACMARTDDFESFERMGVMFAPDNKDIALFPERINGRYYTFHRPAVKHLGEMAIWIASSENLVDWGKHHAVISPRAGFWDSERVGAGAQPIKTPLGWLQLYHASDYNTRYCTGAVLLDLEEPWKVIARSKEPFFVPSEEYETKGFMPNIIFHSGLIDLGNGELELYYGGADLVTCGARLRVDDVLASLGF